VITQMQLVEKVYSGRLPGTSDVINTNVVEHVNEQTSNKSTLMHKIISYFKH